MTPMYMLVVWSVDVRGFPTSVCPCGSNQFRVVVWLDAGYEIEGYGLEAECYSCGNLVTLACPADLL